MAGQQFLAMDSLMSGFPSLTMDPHSEFNPTFFIPRLTDNPQNPIMDTIQQRYHDFPDVIHPPPIEVEVLVDDLQAVAEARQRILRDDLWQRVATKRREDKQQVMSWDALRKTIPSRTQPSAFLSQQDAHVFASVRYHVRPPLHDPSVPLVYVTPGELFQSLHLSRTGLSSSVHIWDALSETFVMRAVPRGVNGILVLVGTDEIVSSSIIQRPLNIGATMRRLEILTESHRAAHPQADQITHSFIHALSSVLDFLRRRLAEPLVLNSEQGSTLENVPNPAAAWMQHAETEIVLEELAALCNRDIDVLPSAYKPLPSSSVDLLSKVYHQLEETLDRHSPPETTAILAYILTIASRDYFRQIGDSLGYTSIDNAANGPDISLRHMHDDHMYGLSILDEEITEGREDTFYDAQPTEEPCPTFVQADIADALPRARRSLRLLREAQPDHPLLTTQRNHQDIRWMWTVEDIAAAWIVRESWTTRQSSDDPSEVHASLSAEGEERVPAHQYKEELKDFALFDLPPGHHLSIAHSVALTSGYSPDDLLSFLANFPPTLPSLTPAMSHLTNLVLAPLVRHMEDLSGALVSLVLSPASLDLPLHLTILRSYLLLTSHTFKSMLAGALFSDTEEQPVLTGRTSSTRKPPDTEDSTRRWAVGISPVLTAANVWPPSVPELSFHLRTVINDSLQSSFGTPTVQPQNSLIQDNILREAEQRLGFAIRDLPSGTSKEKWLDPLSIEALDFLYMDYKPPRPLHVLITPDVLSKYHRIFAFNLRLMRATEAIATTYRITRRASTPLFPTLAQSNKLLHHARFVAHAFVTALSSYIYDSAIGARFNAFLAKLEIHQDEHPHAAHKPPPSFADVFALAEYHSCVLDDILSACLLRSGQKAVGDVLWGCLELVLELAVLAGDRHHGLLEEYQAAPLLEDLWDRFRKKMLTLTRVLRALVERGSGTSPEATIEAPVHLSQLSRLDGVTGDLHDLITRIDVSEWWVRK